MKVVEIQQEEALQELQATWSELLGKATSNTIFLTSEWITAWWSAYGKPGELRVLVATDEDGAVMGIAPMRRHLLKRYGQTVPVISFLGDHSADSDYLDFIIASGSEEGVLEAFGGHLNEELKRGTVLEISELPEASPNFPLLRKIAGRKGMIWQESDIPCAAVRLPLTWDAYLNTLRPRFRTKVRSVLRSLEERPEVRFGFCETSEQVRSMLPVLFELHTKRWAKDGRPGVFGWDLKRKFYFELSSRLLERGWLRFSWLEWKQQVLACQYGFVYQNTYFQLQEGYEPACEHWNVGIGLRAWSIRKFLKQGIARYDFMAGTGRHKSDWGSTTTRSKRLLLAYPSRKTLLFCRGESWSTTAKTIARKLVHESVLADHHAASPLKGHLAESSSSTSTKDWIRGSLANCYFHSGLPAVLRPLRERYELSIANTGHGRGISLHRRSGPSARILYHHRVNDDRDPFFPAISSSLFEQQARFLAQHYRVVSLAGLINHLDGGGDGTVVAITFDDGYQDNYLTAFPILRRYGLPATIFLTTGSIDSREPLWFEQLLQALKKTTRDFVDLEIDLPRRLWLRTSGERLAAYSEIFRILKALPDAERLQAMTGVVRRLDGENLKERNDKMLTWDEIRHMRQHGIDFGGHTVNHPFLSKMMADDVAREVSQCKRRIEEELQSPVRYFAYPNGREEDFGTWNKDLIRCAGYEAAVTTIWGMNYRSTDRMELRRGGPWEETAASFAFKLDWYQFVNG